MLKEIICDCQAELSPSGIQSTPFPEFYTAENPLSFSPFNWMSDAATLPLNDADDNNQQKSSWPAILAPISLKQILIFQGRPQLAWEEIQFATGIYETDDYHIGWETRESKTSKLCDMLSRKKSDRESWRQDNHYQSSPTREAEKFKNEKCITRTNKTKLTLNLHRFCI